MFIPTDSEHRTRTVFIPTEHKELEPKMEVSTCAEPKVEGSTCAEPKMSLPAVSPETCRWFSVPSGGLLPLPAKTQ